MSILNDQRATLTPALIVTAALIVLMLCALPLGILGEEMRLEDLQIRGELLAPKALFIVGGQAADAEAAASVLDYLAAWDDPGPLVPATVEWTAAARLSPAELERLVPRVIAVRSPERVDPVDDSVAVEHPPDAQPEALEHGSAARDADPSTGDRD